MHGPDEASPQTVPDGRKLSTQLPFPSHLSTPSHSSPLAVPVHVTVEAANELAGHEAAEPEQYSATSQASAAARQIVDEGENTSTQLPLPSHLSTPSHGLPLEVPLHVIVVSWKASAGHRPDEPVHVSATSHWPADLRHTVVDGR